MSTHTHTYETQVSVAERFVVQYDSGSRSLPYSHHHSYEEALNAGMKMLGQHGSEIVRFQITKWYERTDNPKANTVVTNMTTTVTR